MVACALVANHGEIVRGIGWGEVLGGIVAGLLASAVIAVAARCWRRHRDRKDFGCLAGTYDVTEKQPTEQPDGMVEVAGDGPVLTFVWTFGDGSVAEGALTMNEQSRVTGAGSYKHVRGSNLGWGYVTLIVASRGKDAAQLLVDGRYTRQKHRDEIATAWVWEMQPELDVAP